MESEKSLKIDESSPEIISQVVVPGEDDTGSTNPTQGTDSYVTTIPETQEEQLAHNSINTGLSKEDSKNKPLNSIWGD